MPDKFWSVPAMLSRNAMRVVSLCEETICEHSGSEKRPNKRNTQRLIEPVVWWVAGLFLTIGSIFDGWDLELHNCFTSGEQQSRKHYAVKVQLPLIVESSIN